MMRAIRLLFKVSPPQVKPRRVAKEHSIFRLRPEGNFVRRGNWIGIPIRSLKSGVFLGVNHGKLLFGRDHFALADQFGTGIGYEQEFHSQNKNSA
jgi:hypothetical protein